MRWQQFCGLNVISAFWNQLTFVVFFCVFFCLFCLFFDPDHGSQYEKRKIKIKLVLTNQKTIQPKHFNTKKDVLYSH